MRNSFAVMLLCAVLLSGCTRPVSYEAFILAKEAADGVYSFELDLADENCSYDISFFTETDDPIFKRRPKESMPIVVTWSLADTLSQSETVYYPLGETKVAYRTGVVMEQPGIWTLRANVASAPEGLRGLGIICKRNENGTRQTP